MSALVLSKAGERVGRAAYAEPMRALTLQNVNGSHKRNFGGPGRDRTDDLFHAMEARSQLRHRPTIKAEKPECPTPRARGEYSIHFRPHLRDSQRAPISSICFHRPVLA